jgi:hypothetical protein
MAEPPTKATTANYGIDAPDVLLRFAVFGAVGVLLGVAQGWWVNWNSRGA